MEFTLSIQELVYVIVAVTTITVGLYKVNLLSKGNEEIKSKLEKLSDQVVDLIRRVDNLDLRVKNIENKSNEASIFMAVSRREQVFQGNNFKPKDDQQDQQDQIDKKS